MPPTVPLKLSMERAVPYSVMEVPSTGMVSVPFAAAYRTGVAFARMRSTFLVVKSLMMVVHAVVSP